MRWFFRVMDIEVYRKSAMAELILAFPLWCLKFTSYEDQALCSD